MRTKFPYSKAVTTNARSNSFSGATSFLTRIFFGMSQHVSETTSNVGRQDVGETTHWRNDLNHPLPHNICPQINST